MNYFILKLIFGLVLVAGSNFSWESAVWNDVPFCIICFLVACCLHQRRRACEGYKYRERCTQPVLTFPWWQ